MTSIRPVTCPRCSGARTLELNSDSASPCPECDGQGWISTFPEEEPPEQHDAHTVEGAATS